MSQEVIEVIEREVEVIEVIERGPQGVAGAAGTGLETLTTEGDILYQGALVGERLPIGTAGQILKVNSTSNAPEWGEAPSTGVTSVTGTAPIASSGGTTPAISISAATQSAAGSMSSTDKTKLDGIAANANNYTHPNHSGDVTSVGDGATTIANDAVTNAKLANMAASTLKGRISSGTGDPEDLSVSDVRTIINVADGTTANTASTATPQALGVAAAGTSNDFARADHVHAMPSASDVGAAADDDARLTDTRDPNAHAASHEAGGDDELTISLEQIPDLGISLGEDPESDLLVTKNFYVEDAAFRISAESQVGVQLAADEASDFSFGINLGAPITFIGTNAATNAATTLSNLGGAASGDIPDPSSATPQALGTAAAGTSDDYSRGDHIHAAPALNDLSNVSAATPSDNDVLVFDTATSTWVAEAPSGGGPSGATNLWIPASAWIPRTTGGCGVDSREIGSTNRQNFDELLFDAGTDEFAQALVIMPSNYNNSTITARFYWTAASGSGDVIWGLQGRAYADDDALDTAHGTAQTATDTLLAADDMHVSAATSAVTIGGTPAANTPIQFQVYRDADAGGDTLAVDARLLGVEIIFN